jgi:hypothetical protein
MRIHQLGRQATPALFRSNAAIVPARIQLVWSVWSVIPQVFDERVSRCEKSIVADREFAIECSAERHSPALSHARWGLPRLFRSAGLMKVPFLGRLYLQGSSATIFRRVSIMTTRAQKEDAQQWTPLTRPSAGVSMITTVGGFGRYHETARSLPLIEQIKLSVLSAFVVDSYQPGNYPVVEVALIGHADTDFQRGKKFELQISEKRAQEIEQALRTAVEKLAPIQILIGPSLKSIKWRTSGVGATEPHPDNVRARKTPQNMTENDRKRNRRVEILMTHSATAFPGAPNEVIRIFLTFAEALALGKLPPPPSLPPWMWDPKIMPKPGTPAYEKLKADVEKALENVDTKTVLASISELRERLGKDKEEEVWLHDFLKSVEDDIKRDREEKKDKDRK